MKGSSKFSPLDARNFKSREYFYLKTIIEFPSSPFFRYTNFKLNWIFCSFVVPVFARRAFLRFSVHLKHFHKKARLLHCLVRKKLIEIFYWATSPTISARCVYWVGFAVVEQWWTRTAKKNEAVGSQFKKGKGINSMIRKWQENNFDLIIILGFKIKQIFCGLNKLVRKDASASL